MFTGGGEVLRLLLLALSVGEGLVLFRAASVGAGGGEVWLLLLALSLGTEGCWLTSVSVVVEK